MTSTRVYPDIPSASTHAGRNERALGPDACATPFERAIDRFSPFLKTEGIMMSCAVKRGERRAVSHA
jgi:hypothetical protein